MLAYYFLTSICFLINLVPIKLRVYVIYLLFCVAVVLIPRLKNTAFTNLKIALPELSKTDHQRILKESLKRFATGLIDTLRLPKIDNNWVYQNVDFSSRDEVMEAIKRAPNQAAIFVTGHYNSFEILPRCISAYIRRTGHFVARALKNPYIDRWWNELRAEQGNRAINRSGSMKKIVDLLKAGECVGFVFDQNVTRKQAVFVDWFGKLAATTKAVAYCHLKLQVPIILVVMHYSGQGRYSIETKIFEFQTDYNLDTNHDIASNQELLTKVTQQVSSAYTDIVKKNPEGWFWLHRRWKTRPKADDRSLYN